MGQCVLYTFILWHIRRPVVVPISDECAKLPPFGELAIIFPDASLISMQVRSAVGTAIFAYWGELLGGRLARSCSRAFSPWKECSTHRLRTRGRPCWPCHVLALGPGRRSQSHARLWPHHSRFCVCRKEGPRRPGIRWQRLAKRSQILAPSSRSVRGHFLCHAGSCQWHDYNRPTLPIHPSQIRSARTGAPRILRGCICRRWL